MAKNSPADNSPFVDVNVGARRDAVAPDTPTDEANLAAAKSLAEQLTGQRLPNAPGEKAFTAGEKPTYQREATTVIVRRKKTPHGAAHGGAWKIAYADFVTAMMAFFLLLWLISSNNVGTLRGIADYFNRPLASVFKNGPGASATTSPQTDEQKKEQQRQEEAKQLEALRTQLTTLIQHKPSLQAFKNQIKIDVTTEGLRIQIIDDKKRPMFDKGDANLKDYTKKILSQIGPALNAVPNHISIAGHTDALGYSGGAGGFTNWELSAERANAARRQLIEGGMAASKVLQVRGLADSIPLMPNDPTNPANRRISIVVLNKQTEDNLRRDGATSTVNVGASTPLDLPANGDADANAAPDAAATP
jgi:chemotaxis protein MotB